MNTAKKMTMTFEPGKPVLIETTGYKGVECKAATKEFEQALGTVISDVDTPEMRQTEQQHVRHGQH